LLAGLVIYIGLLFTLAMLVPMVCAVGVLFIGWLQRKELRKQLANRRLWTAVAWAAGGFLALLLLLRIVAGYRSFEVWRVCYKMNRLFNQASGRTPWKWALYNPADFLIFLGIPTAVLGFWALASGIRKMSSWQKIKQTSPLAPVLLACIMVLNFSGSNLGEVGRLWLFLMPLVTLSCVGMLGRFCLSARKVVLIAVALQILQTLIFRIYLNLMLII